MPTPVVVAVRTTGTATARSQLAGVQRQVGGIGGSLKKLVIGGAAIAGVAGLTRGLVRAGVAVTKMGGDYVNSLNKIQALTGVNNQQLDAAAKKLEAQSGAFAKMGQTTGDAAAGVVELTKAGVSLKDSLAAVRSTMVLAKAGELDVADASTLVANTLNTFGLKAKGAAKIANGLANAANISSADVSDLAESFKYVSPIAAKSGVKLDEVNAVLAELSNSGVKASQAGTGLRKFLLALQAPSGAAKEVIDDLGISVYDARGKMLPFPKVIGNLKGALDGLTQRKQNETLKTIFGLTGITPAQIILKNGVKGLKDYTKGVQRAGAAQKLAEAQSKGLVGTLSQIKANAESTAQSLFRTYSPKINAAIQDVTKWLSRNKDGFREAGATIRDTFLPPIKLVFDLARVGVKALDALPGPVKTLGFEAGIAALVLPRLTAGVTSITSSVGFNIARLQQWRAELTYTETRAKALSTMTGKLGAAARSAAGIGGMLALVDSAKRGDSALGKLERVAGGVLTGFAVGGPWGAAIGGTATLLGTLAGATRRAGVQMLDSHGAAKKLAGSLDEVTGATTRATRAMVLDTITKRLGADGMAVVNKALKETGLTTRDLVGYVLGETAATRRLNGAIKENKHSRDQAKVAAANQLSMQRDFIRGDRQDAREAHRLNAQRRRDLESWKEALHGMPKGVKVKLEQLGYRPNIAQLKALQKKYDLTPKQLRTLIKLTGVEQVVRGAKGAQDALGKVGKGKADLGPFLRSLKSGVGDAKAIGLMGGKQIGGNLHDTTGKARPNLGPFASAFRAAMSAMQAAAQSGGNKAGSNLGSGMAAGVHSWIGNVAAEAQAMVAAAIAAAHKKAESHSPSKATERLGKDLGRGLENGIRARKAKSAQGMAQLMKAVLRAARGGLDDLKRTLRDRLDKGDLKPEQIRKAMRRLGDESKRLEGVAARQRKVNAALADARQKLADLKDQSKEYAASVKSSLIAYASVTNLDSAFNAKGITDALTKRLAKLKQFAGLIEQLTKAGLNKTTLDQLVQGGVEGGLAYAQAIASGGADAIAQINGLESQITAVSGQVGQTSAGAMYDAGIAAAAGLVKGLEARSDELEKVMRRLARKLVKALRDELQIKSPSRVFEDLGGLTVDGLRIGIEAGRARQIGEVLAADLTSGFAKPQLTATAAFDQSVRTGVGAGGVFRLELTAQQLSAIQRGQTLAVDLNAFLAAGGKLVSAS